jgi:hypothetical protein
MIILASITSYMDHLLNEATNNIHNYPYQHLKLASDQMKTCYDRLANCTGYQEGNSHEGEIAQASIPSEWTVPGSHEDKQCGIQVVTEP